MKKLSALVALMIACTAPALAQGGGPDADCVDQQTTGSLSSAARRPAFLAARSARVKMTPPEESWQERAQEDAEQRRREAAVTCPGN